MRRGARWLKLYRSVPGFAWTLEHTYDLVAAHRDWFYRPTLLLWGKHFVPPHYEFTSWPFLRLIGLIFLGGFVSFGVQVLGLIGRKESWRYRRFVR